MQQGGTWEKQKAKVQKENYQGNNLLEMLQEDKDLVERLSKKDRIKKETNIKTSDNTKVNTKNKPELISKSARNKTDKEIAEERKARIEDSEKAQDIPYTANNWREVLARETQATGDKFRFSDSPNFFDDYLNPAVMIGDMASNLGQAPLRAQQSDSVLPYVTAIGTPLAVGAMAGIGTQNTSQFVNNLANPLAGAGDMAKGIYSKGVNALENAGIRTNVAPELREGLRANGLTLNFELFDLNTVRKPSGSIGNQGATSEGANSILESLGIKVKGANPSEVTLKEMVEHLKTNPKDAQTYQKFLEENPISVNELPGGEFQINDGHHRATLSYYSGKEKIPTIIKNKGEYTRQSIDDNFKSEINWGNWNKEIPDNPQLMQEYNAIEQQAKANGTWMKNPDGSEFKGTPEQFVQQNSENFKKAFGKSEVIDETGSIIRMYHSSPKNNISEFSTPKRLENFETRTATTKDTDYTFFTPNKEKSKIYGDNTYEVYINSQNPKNVSGIKGESGLPIMWNPEQIKNKELYDSITNIDFNNIKNEIELGNKKGYFKEIAVPNGNYTKSAIGNNGMFDMTNPNIYKSIAPIAGASYLATQGQEEPKKFQQGGKFTENENKFLEELSRLKLI